MKVAIINGPNLNLVGTREPEIYGSEGFDSLLNKLKSAFPTIEISYFQSNIEGEIVDAIQRSGFSHDGIILNAGGYTHTSVAIADAVAAVPALVIEVHLSNIFAREEVRRTSLLSEKVKGVISGFGMSSYEMALLFITKSLNTSR